MPISNFSRKRRAFKSPELTLPETLFLYQLGLALGQEFLPVFTSGLHPFEHIPLEESHLPAVAILQIFKETVLADIFVKVAEILSDHQILAGVQSVFLELGFHVLPTTDLFP